VAESITGVTSKSRGSRTNNMMQMVKAQQHTSGEKKAGGDDSNISMHTDIDA